ncbi:MAG: phage portal protein [Ruminococcus sp.]|nr:phage portal protein [Ruminococcus sp.]
MGIFDIFRRAPTKRDMDAPNEVSRLQMVTMFGDYFYAWDGKLYKSDIIRACVRPAAQAIGKLVAKHLRHDKEGLTINPQVNIAMLLKYPNPQMTAQQFQEKMAFQLLLNNNAFALIERDFGGKPVGLYPINCRSAEKLEQHGRVAIRFQMASGKMLAFWYDDLIHLRRDFCEDEFFGSPNVGTLVELMDCVGTIDQGIVKAIKNSNAIRWLLKFSQSMRPEDVKKNVREFVDNYMSYESESFGAAGVDAKVDAKQIEPKDYVPNAAITDRLTDRVYSFFNVSDKIVQSKYTEDEWNAYYEAQIEPIAIQFGQVMTYKLFTRKEISFGNEILFEASNLQCASMTTKLQLVQFLDRGIMNANEIRAVLNLPPIPGGDVYVRRLDTVPVENTEEVRQDEA